MWLFYYFDFKRNYDVLKLNDPCILLNKEIRFNKNETESKLEKPQSFKETKESQIKSKTMMSWNSRKKQKDVFCTIFLLEGTFFNLCVLSQCVMY